ncbi:unnamed protein product [Phytophthora fragariaefolia]|uniref:Unnamed protein product n=1 Tax=Phytophthora fragariaefolia TaxID=1490495 RepID=A0A9W7CXY4_9STRA|nr:unnamed protein product [Phytophthora fragariaefolia]
MAYDPYKSLLANASREHLKRSADLNTHLVGNVFLPAIDSQHKKLPKSTASLKHLKVIEQCILAENKREERLAKCATIKDRRILTKKFQAQRERERELIQALMLGSYPERQHDIKLIETEVIPTTTPRQQINQETTGLSARVPTPDRVFRKADITGGVPKAKPHAHKKFKLPECNRSPGKKIDAKAQIAASTRLYSPTNKNSPTVREVRTENSDLPTRKKRSPSQSAGTVRSRQKDTPKTRTDDSSAETVETKESPSSGRTPSPYISLQQHQSRIAQTPQLSTLPCKLPTETFSEPVESTAADGAQQIEITSVSFEGALSFSEAQRIAMGDEPKPRIDRIFAEIATQTTPRLQDNTPKSYCIKKVASRVELPPVNPTLVGELNQDASASTPRRPHSTRAIRSTRQAFLEGLAREPKIYRKDNQESAQSLSSVLNDSIDAESVDSNDQQNLSESEIIPQANQEDQLTATSSDPADEHATTEADYSEDDEHTVEDDPEQVHPDADDDEDLETDVAEVLFDLVDMVEAAIVEEERQNALPMSRTVSPRPRSSMVRASPKSSASSSRTHTDACACHSRPRAERLTTCCVSNRYSADTAPASRSASRCTRTH